MDKSIYVRLACVSAAALLSGLGVVEQANAGGFGVREQSAYFEGMGYAGSAAGGDISSMFWNSRSHSGPSGLQRGGQRNNRFPQC